MLIPGELIPIMALGIGAIAVIGRVIVQPIVQALVKYTEQQRVPPPATGELERRIAALEERLDLNERSTDRLLADRDFYQQLQSGQRPPPPPGERP